MGFISTLDIKYNRYRAVDTVLKTKTSTIDNSNNQEYYGIKESLVEGLGLEVKINFTMTPNKKDVLIIVTESYARRQRFHSESMSHILSRTDLASTREKWIIRLVSAWDNGTVLQISLEVLRES